MSDAPTDSDEKILWSGSVSHWHYAGKWLVIVIFLGALAGSFFTHLVVDPSAFWIARGFTALVALITFIWICLDRSKRKYSVTNRRVSVEFGIISKRSNELRIQDIRSINLATTGISGLAGIGRLEFSSAATDDADVIFWNVGGAEKLRDMVRSLQA